MGMRQAESHSPRGSEPGSRLPPMDVVVCTLDSAHSIAECLKSVFREVPVNRLIVVDGGSTDGTLDLVNGFPRLELHYRPDLSLGQSRAFGFSLARTEYLLQIDSDVVLRCGWGQIAVEFLGKGDVVEFGTEDHYSFRFPEPDQINSRDYQRRAFFFTNVIRSSFVQDLDLDVRHMEEELTRRIVSRRGGSWVKTGVVHADHYSRPVRYDGRRIVRTIPVRPRPDWTHFDHGKIDGYTGLSIWGGLVGGLRVGLAVSLGPFRWVVRSLGNPVSACLHYWRGFYRGRRWARSRPIDDAVER